MNNGFELLQVMHKILLKGIESLEVIALAGGASQLRT